MRPFRSVLAVAGAILVLSVTVPIVSATSTPHPLHVTKDCSAFTGVAPSSCTIKVSDLAALPVGTKVLYTGPVLANSYFLSSNVTLDAGGGSTATGYCIFEAKTSKGLCSYWAGTGSLTGFTSVVDVSIDADGLWHWDGEYYFDDTAAAAPATDVEDTGVSDSQDRRPG